MKKISLLLFLSFSLTSVFAQIEGTWVLAPQAGALSVGPALDNLTWWSNTEGDVTGRACLFDDKFVFGSDGTFTNVQDGETWVETWQGAAADGCDVPVTPHDNSNAATWSYDGGAGTITLSGVGAHLGLPKAINGDELDGMVAVPASITYDVALSGDGNTMTVDIGIGGGFWRFILAKEGTITPPTTDLSGIWRIAPEAGALGVGPNIGDVSWWSNTEADVTTRACLFDDRFVLSGDGTFSNEQDAETWLETWQGAASEGCGTPIAPHDGSNAATWSYDEMAGTITVTGEGAHLGLSKVINGDELDGMVAVPASVTYPVALSDEGNTMTIDIEVDGGVWHFVLTKNEVVDPPVDVDLTGEWRIAPEAGALGVGPNIGDVSWWSNTEADVTTRACLFDDKYVFNMDGSFMNVQDGSTWVETWQGAAAEGCGTPIAPHDGSNAATWSYDEMAGTITITGEGAHLGLSKVINGDELDGMVAVPASVTYPVVFSNEGNTMTIDIEVDGGFWHFVLTKEEVVDPPVDVDLTGEWRIAPEAGALGVGPNMGDVSWWSNTEADVTTRACLFDDKYVFNMDGSFMNVQDGSTWVETWQGAAAEGCDVPVAPHDGSNAATWSYDEMAGTITITGEGAHLGLSKVINGDELDGMVAVPASVTYPVVFSNEGNTMTIDIEVDGGFWHFVLTKEEVVDPPVDVDLTGEWRIVPEAGALGVGPNVGDVSWWSNTEADVTTRACLFDDKYVFNMDGSFMNVQDGSTWVETWQGAAAEGCDVPVAPHDGSNAATWSYDEMAGTITITGEGAHLGLSKVINGDELDGMVAVPASVTYPVVFSDEGNTMTIDIEVDGGFWHFVLTKEEVVDPPVEVDFEGTWVLAPEAGALGVGPNMGDVSWWSNADSDVVDRACLFDDKFVFDENGTFMNVQDGSTWLEPWQGVTEEGCGTPVAPHDGSNAATWTYNENDATVTITGEGAHLGLSKVINGGELDGMVAVPASITYPVVFSDEGDRMTIDIDAGLGYWHFVLVRDETIAVTEVVKDLFSFYPNPATSEIRINSIQQMDQFIVRDITGRVLMVKKNPTQDEVINISSLSTGMYLLESRSGNQISVQKFIVE